MGDAVTGEQVVEVITGLEDAGVPTWVVGGWGIDALLGQQTRDHHDVDLLVEVRNLPRLEHWLSDEGFQRTLVWEESSRVEVDGPQWETAFVARHPDGREIDIHSIWLDANGSATVAAPEPVQLIANALDGMGTIAGQQVRCATPDAQRSMHQGYELPDKHHEDLRRLDALDRG